MAENLESSYLFDDEPITDNSTKFIAPNAHQLLWQFEQTAVYHQHSATNSRHIFQIECVMKFRRRLWQSVNAHLVETHEYLLGDNIFVSFYCAGVTCNNVCVKLINFSEIGKSSGEKSAKCPPSID